MKKILILAYDFPPYVSVGGLRPYNWYKYLKKYGVEPIVITRNWNVQHNNSLDYITASETDEVVTEVNEWGTVIRTPYHANWSNRLLLKYGENRFRLVRKAGTAFFEYTQYLWITGTKKELFKAANKYLKENKVDVIIATADPFVLFSYANKLSRKYEIPWIADYRDPWSQDKKFQKNRLSKKWNTCFEQKIVKGACAITTVSELLADSYKTFFQKEDVLSLPNGFDPGVALEVEDIAQSTRILTFSFVGTIYEWHPWKSFIRVFSELLETTDAEMALHFYGVNKEDEIEDVLHQLPLKTQQSVKVYPRMPNADLLKRIASENVMLLFNYYAFPGTKIYDYLAIKRQILFCYSNDVEALKLKAAHFPLKESITLNPQVDMLKATNGGVIAENRVHLREILVQLLQEFQETGQIANHSVGVNAYSREIQVKKLAELINRITD